MVTALLLILIGLLSGIISGMGIGGGAILIPALSIFFSFSQQQAQSTNLIYFIPTASIALVTHFKEGNIEKSYLKSIILFGLFGAVIGSVIAVKTEPEMLKSMFGWFLLIMGILEFFKKENK